MYVLTRGCREVGEERRKWRNRRRRENGEMSRKVERVERIVQQEEERNRKQTGTSDDETINDS